MEHASVTSAPVGASSVTPRLTILKMVMENFKSYGGVKEIGPFHKSFSSVVGPNGSGKSNVIDAMLFVFGKRASKMRLNKVSAIAGNEQFSLMQVSELINNSPLCRFLSSSTSQLNTPSSTMLE